jgi:hypothetical protein
MELQLYTLPHTGTTTRWLRGYFTPLLQVRDTGFYSEFGGFGNWQSGDIVRHSTGKSEKIPKEVFFFQKGKKTE